MLKAMCIGVVVMTSLRCDFSDQLVPKQDTRTKNKAIGRRSENGLEKGALFRCLPSRLGPKWHPRNLRKCIQQLFDIFCFVLKRYWDPIVRPQPLRRRRAGAQIGTPKAIKLNDTIVPKLEPHPAPYLDPQSDVILDLKLYTMGARWGTVLNLVLKWFWRAI